MLINKINIKTLMISFVIIFALVGVGYVFLNKKSKTTDIEASIARFQKLDKNVTLSGNIESASSKELYAPVNQKVVKVYAKEGDNVGEGFLIAETDKSDLELQLQKLVVTKMELQRSLDKLIADSSDSSLQELRNNLGQTLKRLKVREKSITLQNLTMKKAKEQYNSAAISNEELKSIEDSS